MNIMQSEGIEIAAISVAVPTKRIPVTIYNNSFGEDVVSKFSDMTGVKYLHRAIKEQTASDLGYEAAVDAISKAGISRKKIGIVIFVSQKPDFRVPSTAYLIHNRLGLSEACVCFDINLACSGYVYALNVISSILDKSDAEYALLISGDTSSRTMSPHDKTLIMLFGDSGTATILKKSCSDSVIYGSMRTDGKRFKAIVTPSGAYRNPDGERERTKWSDGIKRCDYDTHMKGMDVFSFSITDVPKLMKEFMKEIKTTPDDYDVFALHQANLYIMKQISRKLKIPFEKIPASIENFGNNSSNSVPLVLADHFGTVESGRRRVLMNGFGAGLSWACCDVTVDLKSINSIIYTDNYYDDNE